MNSRLLTIRPVCHSLQSTVAPSRQQPFRLLTNSRSVLFSDASTPSKLTAFRSLPYPALPLFEIITDIESYPQFLPYCTASRVLATSNADAHYKRRWPQTASLTAGFNDNAISASFTSRVWCVPPVPEKGRAGLGICEAVSGSKADGQSTYIPDGGDIEHHTHTTDTSHEIAENSLLDYIRTRWEVRAYPYKPGPEETSKIHDENLEPQTRSQERTDVSLTIDYKFKSSMYDAVMHTMSGKIADSMIDAFEKRAEQVLGHPPAKTRND